MSTIHKAFVRFIYLFFFRGRGKACGLVPFLVACLDDVAALTGGHLTSQLRFFNHNRKRALPFFRDANVSHTRYLCASRPAGNLYKNILRDTEGKDVTHLESIRSCSYLLRCFFQSIPTLAAVVADEEYFYSNGLIFLLDRRNVPQETTECGQIVIPWREAAPHRLGCAISSTYFFLLFPPSIIFLCHDQRALSSTFVSTMRKLIIIIQGSSSSRTLVIVYSDWLHRTKRKMQLYNLLQFVSLADHGCDRVAAAIHSHLAGPQRLLHSR